jgi:glycogen operon protein
VTYQRSLWQRALLATLFLAQGTPQLLAGDELGHSQGGNNNAYCQDNPTTWLDWHHGDSQQMAFVAGLTRLRRTYPALRYPRWFQGPQQPERRHQYRSGCDIAWLKPDGFPLNDQDWQNPQERALACVMEVGEADGRAMHRVMLLFNPTAISLCFELPQGPWQMVLNTATAEFETGEMLHTQCEVSRCAVVALAQAIDAFLSESRP